jgi:integrase
VALGLPATLQSLLKAEELGLRLGSMIRSDFSWEAWDALIAPPEHEAQKVIDAHRFREAARELHALKYRKDPVRGESAWGKKWKPALNKVPLSGEINEKTLIRVLRTLPAGSAVRRDQGNILSQVAKHLGMNEKPIIDVCRGYGVDRISERDIPTDSDITKAFEQIGLPHWRYTFGMCAAFGLRPHEVSEAIWLENNWIEVGEKTKTGSRRVRACHGGWVEKFKLRDLPRPKQKPLALSRPFSYGLERDGVAIKPYNLRHAYALRLMSVGVTADLGARLMGHSLTVHQSTYQRWIEADRIQKALQAHTF